MPRALELITGRVTAPGAAFTAWTPSTGNALTIRNGRAEKAIFLLTAFAKNQGVGTLRIRSPLLHDNVNGLRMDVTAGLSSPLLPLWHRQRLQPQDLLTVEQLGSAGAGDLELGGFLVYYEDLPGVDAQLITYEDLIKRGLETTVVENTIATTATGDYGGEEAINAEVDQFKANSPYAVVGYLVDTLCGVIRYRGSDTGNLGVGGPGEPTLRHQTAEWFARLARETGLPLIPVFNSANRAAFLVDATQDENGADVTVSTILVRLAP